MKTIKNNDSETTYYTLSIDELKELCEEFCYSKDDIDNVYSFIELYVGYLLENRESQNKYIEILIKLCRDFMTDCHDGFVSNDRAYIEQWLIKFNKNEI